MSSRTNTKPTTPDVSTATADDYRAFADFLQAGNTASFADWFASPAGEAQRTAFADQQAAAARAKLQSAVRAVWRDIKNNGQVTTYSGVRAQLVRDMLTSLDYDALPAPTAKVSDDTADDAADDAAETPATA